MGRIYKRGRLWWGQYYRQGELFRESSRSKLRSVATSLIKKREGEVIDGRLPALQAAKTTFEDLAALYLQDYAINHRKSAQRARELAASLGKAFNRFRAHAITSPRIGEYIAKRQADGVSNATINRELAALQRMFRLAAQQTPPLVLTTPYIPHLREDNVRTGFFTEEEYRVLRAALPDHLKIPFIIAYHTGMRAGEIHWLRWEQVDLEAGWLRLEPGTTKNGRGRMIPLTEEVRDILQRWKDQTLLKYPACPWIVHFRGKRMQRVQKKLWDKICDRVGLPGKLFHDLRRTAIRNMVRAGISERVAMEISGHKTRSVFDRYDIVTETDLRIAAQLLASSQSPKNFLYTAGKIAEYSCQIFTMHNDDMKPRKQLDGVTR